MCFLKRAFYGLLLLCACAGNGFATPLFIQSGTWIVDSELNGLPGRGMAIDVQNQHLVMQVYNYNRAGRPTFHLASGPLNGLQFKGPLSQYRGGRFFGSGERVGWEDEVAGEVRIRFESSTSGFIQFPGEPEVAMSRFRFDAVPEGFALKPGSLEGWLAMEYDEQGSPYAAWHLELRQGAGPDKKLSLTVASAPVIEKSMSTVNPCTLKKDGWIRCDVMFEQGESWQRPAVFEIRRSVNGLEGFITRTALPNLIRKLRGNKYHFYDDANSVDHRLVHTKNLHGKYTYVPEPGTWIVSSELNGKPGRGMALDWQNGVIVMQVYNYEENGDPSFHLGVGKVSDNPSSGTGTMDVTTRLKRYAGGRYFGSDGMSGHEDADVGEVQMVFLSPLKGRVKFPGESWKDMEKFQFGYGEKNPQALLGIWALQNVLDQRWWLELFKVEGKYALGQSVMCHFDDPDEKILEYRGTVRCVTNYQNEDFQQIFTFDFSPDYRAVPAFSYQRSYGKTHFPEKGFAVQVFDKNRTPIGFDSILH